MISDFIVVIDVYFLKLRRKNVIVVGVSIVGIFVLKIVVFFVVCFLKR